MKMLNFVRLFSESHSKALRLMRLWIYAGWSFSEPSIPGVVTVFLHKALIHIAVTVHRQRMSINNYWYVLFKNKMCLQPVQINHPNSLVACILFKETADSLKENTLCLYFRHA